MMELPSLSADSLPHTIIAEIHGAATRLIGDTTSSLYEGLSQASRALKKHNLIDSNMAKKLVQLDYAFAWTRHSSTARGRLFLRELQHQLCRAGTPCDPSSSGPLPPSLQECVPSPTIQAYQNLVNAQNDSIAALSRRLEQVTNCAPPRPGRNSKLSPPKRARPADDPGDDKEIEHYKSTIAELRTQAAQHAAVEARRSHLQEQGRVLRTLRIPAGATDAQFRIGEVFTQFSGISDELVISEPYLVSGWQVANLRELVHALATKTHIKRIRLSTHVRSRSAESLLSAAQEVACGLDIDLSIAFCPDIHLRELSYSNGVTISADRGLDLFQAPNSLGVRSCRAATVIYFEMSQKELANQANIAISLADEAKAIIAQSEAQDVRRIKALVATPVSDTSDAAELISLRHQMENAHIKDALNSSGYTLKDMSFEGFVGALRHQFWNRSRGCFDPDKNDVGLEALLRRLPGKLDSLASLGFARRKQPWHSFNDDEQIVFEH